METSVSYQQGDVVLIPWTGKPGTVIADRPLAVGEGHHEHVMVGDVTLREVEEDGVRSLLATVGVGGGQLVHRRTGGGEGEHGTIQVSPGIYRVGIVHEWDVWAHEAKQVVD